MANETWKFVQAKSKQAMKQEAGKLKLKLISIMSKLCILILGIRDEKARMKATPPLEVAPVTQEDDMRWTPNDDGIVLNL